MSRVLFLVIISFVTGILYSFSKSNDFLKRDPEFGHMQQQIIKRLPSSDKEKEIKLWRSYLKKYPLSKDAIELELLYSFPSEDLLEKDIYLWGPTKIGGDISGNIFVSDQKWRHVFMFDSRGNFLKKIGREGQGPGEFMNPYCINLTKDFLIVSDTGTRKIQFFDRDGKYVKSIKVRKSYTEIVNDANGLIYASGLRMSKESPLIDVLDKDGHLLNSFGKARFGNETGWNVLNFLKLAVNSKGEIFAAYQHFPTVCKYSRKGELLVVYRIEQEIMKERERLNLDSIREQKGIYYPVIYAIRIGRNGFYILYNYPRTHILEFDTNGKLLNDYYYVKSHDYRVEDFIVKETGVNDKIFYMMQRGPDYRVSVFGIRNK